MIEKYLERFRVNDEAFKEMHLNLFEATIAVISDITQLLPSNTNIKVLDLHHNEIDDDCVEALSKALKKNKSVEYVDLSNNQITETGIDAIVDLLKANKNITKLKIGKNYLGSRGIEKLSSVLETSALTSLDISYVHMKDDNGINALANVLNKTRLISLNISHNKIRADGARMLAGVLESNTSLRKINLSNNALCSCGIGCVKKALSTATIYSVKMCKNASTTAEVEMIDEAVFENPDILYASYEDMAQKVSEELETRRYDLRKILCHLNNGEELELRLECLSKDSRMIEFFAKKEGFVINPRKNCGVVV
ncbi:MAG: hypothetical protein ACK5WS_03200 [Alphaproteobacteria bacterium]|jgi:Ran GTPase-activating protein (RanGAP) involved in mRNA processing and transport|nr:hypothetical protein [Candidatus Jidaibacter sp.]